MTTTTAGTEFSSTEAIDLARLVYKRFGNDMEAACAAWRRMLQNQCPVEDFAELVCSPTHTEHCQGECQTEDPLRYDY